MSFMTLNPTAGKAGIIRDVDPSQLPTEGWSDGRNIRTLNGRLLKTAGVAAFLSTCPIVPYTVFAVRVQGIVYWIACGLAKVYVSNGTTWFNITRQTAGVDVDYNMTVFNKWSIDFFNGVIVLNNQVDDPQQWPAGVTSTRLTMLTNWPTGNSTQFIRSYKEFLFAFGGQIGASAATYTLLWSSPASPGSVPGSWNYADPASQAGEAPISSTGGVFVDALSFGDNFIIYKTDSCYRLTFVGGNSMFQLSPIFMDIGMLNLNCGVEFMKHHYVVTPDDIVIHDTFTWTSIIDGKMRNWLFGQMDSVQVRNCFVVKNSKKSEVWFCFPSKGATYPDTALVWSYRDSSLVVVDLPLVTSGVEYIVDPTAVDDSWSGGAAGTFDSFQIPWNTDLTDVTNKKVILCSPATSQLYELDQTETFNGALIEAYAERTGYSALPNNYGALVDHPELIKQINAVYPKMRATGPVNIYIGAQDTLNDPIRWVGPFAYDARTQNKIAASISGGYLGFRIYSKADIHWELDSIGFDIELVGKF